MAHPKQCTRCRLSEPLCICDRITPVNISFQIVIIRHKSESNRSSNSARLAELCIPQASIISTDSNTIPKYGSEDWLLFPHYEECKKANLTKHPKRLFVLDGTWRQVRRMRTRIGLDTVPHFQPNPLPNPPPRIRKPSFIGGMSTMESICAAINILEGRKEAENLTRQLGVWVNAVARLTGIETPILSGQCFTDVRRLEEAQRKGKHQV